MEKLEHDTKLSVEWFENNYMKLNEDKRHLLVSGHKYETIWAKIGEARIWESTMEKLLGGISMIACLFCIKNQKKKLSPLAKTTSYMSFEKK